MIDAKDRAKAIAAEIRGLIKSKTFEWLVRPQKKDVVTWNLMGVLNVERDIHGITTLSTVLVEDGTKSNTEKAAWKILQEGKKSVN